MKHYIGLRKCHHIGIQLFGNSITLLLFMFWTAPISGYAQREVHLIGEAGIQKALYKTTSNNNNLEAPRDIGIPMSLGLQFEMNDLLASVTYEIRNFQEAGPRYGDHLAGLNQFGISLFNYLHSLNISAGVDLLKSKKRIKLVPQIGFGLGYINADPIVKREPTVNDSDNYSWFSVSSVEDSTLSQTGHMHAIYTSRFIPRASVGLRLSYAISDRLIFFTRAVYTHGLIKFYKAKFNIKDVRLDEPIVGRVSYSGSALGIRFGIAYRLNWSKDN